VKDPWIISIGVFSLAIATALIIFAGKNNFDASPTEPKIDESNPPKLEISEKEFYLKPGIKIRQKDILVGNSGKTPLTLYAFAISSDTISAKFINNAKESPNFKTSASSWKTELNPDAVGTLRITFNQNKINWLNPSDQFVTFKSNDPQNLTVKVVFSSTPIASSTSNNSTDSNQQNDSNTTFSDQ
jgi:hypothetical protein